MIFFAASKSSFEWSIVKSCCCSAISLWLFITSLQMNFDDDSKTMYYNLKEQYLVVHLYFVVFRGFSTDQKDLVAEKLTGIRA